MILTYRLRFRAHTANSLCCLCAWLVISGCSVVLGVDNFWGPSGGNPDGNWSDAAHWDLGHPPTSSDQATFAAPVGSYVVTVDSSPTIGSLKSGPANNDGYNITLQSPGATANTITMPGALSLDHGVLTVGTTGQPLNITAGSLGVNGDSASISTLRVLAGSRVTFDHYSEAISGHVQVSGPGSGIIQNGTNQGYFGGSFAVDSGFSNGSTSVLTGGMVIGYGGSAATAVSVESGAAVLDVGDVVVGQGGATGSLALKDAGSQFVQADGKTVSVTSTGSLAIASDATAWLGGLNVASGGTLNFSDGFLTIDGGTYSQPSGPLSIHGSNAIENPTFQLINGATTSGVTDLRVGETNAGNVVVRNGSTLSSTTAHVGVNVGAAGSVSVYNGGEWIATGEIYLGMRGASTVDVSGGGHISDDQAYVGFYPGVNSTVFVRDSGSTWTTSGFLDVGHAGNGTLIVSGGGHVSSQIIVIANGMESLGTTVVTGSGSELVGSYLDVGESGRGTLEVLNGGHVSSAIGSVAVHDGSVGTVNVSGTGSRWTNTDSLHVGGYTGPSGGTGSVSVSSAGEVVVTGATKIWDTGTVALNGGALSTGMLEGASPAAQIHLTGNNNTIAITGGTSNFVGTISGAGGFIKDGAGTLELATANTYSGVTSVIGGVLSVTTGSLANNNFDRVVIAATDSTLAGNPILSRSASSIGNSYAGVGSTAGGDLGSTAELLSGSIVTGTSVDMQWRQRAIDELPEIGTSPPLPFAEHNGLISDVLSLTGLGTDKFVLEISYDPALLPGGAASEASLLASKSIYLGWLDPSGLWRNAVLGNSDADTVGMNLYYPNTSWSNTASLNTLGAWGVDTSGTIHHVWAVLDHNSEFAAVPEPGSITLLLAGCVVLPLARRKRGREGACQLVAAAEYKSKGKDGNCQGQCP